jgi:hypothetical protein
MKRCETAFAAAVTGWSLVRIRPGEPNKTSSLGAKGKIETGFRFLLGYFGGYV